MSLQLQCAWKTSDAGKNFKRSLNPWYDGNHFLRQDRIMDKKQRIARAFLSVMQDIDVPAFKNITPGELHTISLRDNLDSLGMVNLIIGLEDALKQEFGKDIAILGRGDVFSTDSLQNAGKFIGYIEQIV